MRARHLEPLTMRFNPCETTVYDDMEIVMFQSFAPTGHVSTSKLYCVIKKSTTKQNVYNFEKNKLSVEPVVSKSVKIGAGGGLPPSSYAVI